jgi:hypothetical protein
MDKIDDIVVTLDTHNPDHIAHALFWNSAEDGSGIQPVPFQRITHDDVLGGKWFPLDRSMKVSSINVFQQCSILFQLYVCNSFTFQEHCLQYTKALEEKGRFTLTIWPPHCLVTTI